MCDEEYPRPRRARALVCSRTGKQGALTTHISNLTSCPRVRDTSHEYDIIWGLVFRV